MMGRALLLLNEENLMQSPGFHGHPFSLLPALQGCIRRGGREGLKGGREVWLGPPSSQGPPMVPDVGQKNLSLNPLGTEGAKAKFWLSASNIGREGGGVVGGGGVLLRCTAVLIHHCPSPHGSANKEATKAIEIT